MKHFTRSRSWRVLDKFWRHSLIWLEKIFPAMCTLPQLWRETTNRPFPPMLSSCYQFNCSSDALHLAFVHNVPDSTEGKKIKSRHYSPTPWEFPPPPPHHLDLGEYRHNTRSATIAFTATSPTTILPLGSVRFPVFYEESHHFFRPNFVHGDHHGREGERWDFRAGKFIFKCNPLPFFPINHWLCFLLALSVVVASVG